MTYTQAAARVRALQRELSALDLEAIRLFREVKDKRGFGPRDAYGVLENLHLNIQSRHREIRSVLLSIEGRSPNAECDETATGAIRVLEEAIVRYRKNYEYALGRSRT